MCSLIVSRQRDDSLQGYSQDRHVSLDSLPLDHSSSLALLLQGLLQEPRGDPSRGHRQLQRDRASSGRDRDEHSRGGGHVRARELESDRRYEDDQRSGRLGRLPAQRVPVDHAHAVGARVARESGGERNGKAEEPDRYNSNELACLLSIEWLLAKRK